MGEGNWGSEEGPDGPILRNEYAKDSRNDELNGWYLARCPENLETMREAAIYVMYCLYPTRLYNRKSIQTLPIQLLHHRSKPFFISGLNVTLANHEAREPPQGG